MGERQRRRQGNRFALGYGLVCGLLITILGVGNAVLQAYRHMGGPERRPLVAASYGLLVLAVGLANLVASRATQRTGHPRTGLLAGAMVGLLPTLALIIGTNLPAAGKLQLSTGSQIAGFVIAVALFAALGMAIGAMVSLPGALVGRSAYRFSAAVPHEVLPSSAPDV